MKNTVFLNIKKINYDRKLEFSELEKITNVTFYEETKEEEILTKAANQQIIITKELSLSRDIIERLPECVELILEAGTGYNNIDVKAARERNITVCNIPSYSSKAVAQLTFALMLSLASSLTRQQVMLHENNFSNFTGNLMLNHVEVAGKTLGILGAGRIAGEVIRLARAFDMKVLVYSRTLKEFQDKLIQFVSLEELLRDSDFVTIHCPLTEDTRYLIDKAKIALMKPSAFLINTARGAIIKEEDLTDALRRKVIAGAGLDVLEQEPVNLDNPLFALDNCILTPHIGWQCIETRQRLIHMLSDNIGAYLADKPINKVN